MTPATSDAGRVVACVQHGNSFLEINNGHKRFAVTVPVEIASAVKQDAATLSALQRKLDAVSAYADELETSQLSSNLGSLHAAGAAAGFRHAIDGLRALLGGDGEGS